MKIEEVVDLQASFVRILVVDDFTPWQLFVQTFLGQDPNLSIIGFASDGLEAGNHRGNLAAIDAAHPGLPTVGVKVDMKNAFAFGASMVGGLHRPGDGVTADAGAMLRRAGKRPIASSGRPSSNSA